MDRSVVEMAGRHSLQFLWYPLTKSRRGRDENGQGISFILQLIILSIEKRQTMELISLP